MLTSIDLFSCIGCHAIGMERAGIRTARLCEISPWRRARLAERFPETAIIENVKDWNETGSDCNWPDIVFGGPPCQKTSVASAIHGSGMFINVVGARGFNAGEAP